MSAQAQPLPKVEYCLAKESDFDEIVQLLLGHHGHPIHGSTVSQALDNDITNEDVIAFEKKYVSNSLSSAAVQMTFIAR